jgi:hypothetical protein
MTILNIGSTAYRICQKKTNPEIKVVLTLNESKTAWANTVYSGTMEEVKAWIRHQRKLSDKRELRSMIADMCGTSYQAAMEDMGMKRK